MNIKLIKNPQEENKLSMLAILDSIKEQVKNGEITRLGIVMDKPNEEWSTVFSNSDDCRVDAAMLLELAIRRLGFKPGA